MEDLHGRHAQVTGPLQSDGYTVLNVVAMCFLLNVACDCPTVIFLNTITYPITHMYIATVLLS